jgi:hypothetical protein
MEKTKEDDMRIVYYLFIIILFGLNAFAYAQLPYEFTQLASINGGGEANDLIVTSDSTLLLANGPDGLRAYTFEGSSFSNLAHINDGGSAMSVVESSDGTIFLANGDDGLRAYSYDGSSFTNLAHVNDGGSAMDVAIASDGTVFLANRSDGLRAYSYDGASFTNMGHIDDGGSPHGVAVDIDSTIFLANGGDGLRAYSYDGNSFTNTAHIDSLGNYSAAYGVTLAPDGTVFLAGGYSGLSAYAYDGSSFTRKANASSSSEAYDMSFDSSGTVFLAIKNGWLGGSSSLWAYDYNGDSLTPTASINADSALGVVVGEDGTVFLANGSAGLFAYSYGLATGIDDNSFPVPGNYILEQNYPNPFNPSTIIEFTLPQSGFVTLKVYNLLGQKVATLLEAHKPAGQHIVNFNASALTSGIYYYTLTTDDFRQTRKMVLLR